MWSVFVFCWGLLKTNFGNDLIAVFFNYRLLQGLLVAWAICLRSKIKNPQYLLGETQKAENDVCNDYVLCVNFW